jgi:hypothetical protein
MAKQIEFHNEFSKLPESPVRAKQLGEPFYFTGKRCTKGHLSTRYASSGNCVQCIADKRGKSEIFTNKNRFFDASEENIRRAKEAINNGFSFYEPETPCPNGHYKRFVTTHNCIICGGEQTKKRKENARWARIRKQYSLSEDEVNAMLKKQNSCCLICNADIYKNYHIDHCHKRGIVRGLLCSKCNQAIGLFQEDANRMKIAIDYLRGFN